MTKKRDAIFQSSTGISNLPVEILEEIFLYLNKNDLVTCSYVCYQWREIINCNNVWSVQSAKEKIHHKQFLLPTSSLISNPVKKYHDPFYEPGTRLTLPCHWRSYFNRYKFLERNWRNGQFTVIRSKVEAAYYRDGLIMSINSSGLGQLWSIDDLHSPISIEKRIRIDCVRTKGDLVFYSQEYRLTCLKLSNSRRSFIELYEITVGDESDHLNDCRTMMTLRVALKIADNFLLFQDAMRACSLYFYDYKTGDLFRKVDLHGFVGQPCPKITTVEASNGKVFVAYNLDQHYVLVYNYYKPDKVVIKMACTAPYRSQLVVSENFFGSKLTRLTLVDDSCELIIWSADKGNIAATEHIQSNSSLPVILTSNDKLVYADSFKVYVRDLRNKKQNVELPTTFTVLSGMEYVWCNLLVLNLGTCVQLWDIEKGQRMNTYLRESRNVFQRMWVDDRTIVVSLTTTPTAHTKTFVISFW